MIFLSIALSAVLAAVSPWAIRRVAAEAMTRGWIVAVPLAMLIAGVLSWSVMRVTTGSIAAAVAMGVVGAVLAVQLVIDLAVRRLPRIFSYSGLLVFVALMAFVPADQASGLIGALIGAFAMTAVTAAFVVLSRGSLGLGDLHLAPLLGALVGWFAPTGILSAWVITALAGASVTLIGLATRRLERRSTVPYGPFLVFGATVAVVISAVRR